MKFVEITSSYRELADVVEQTINEVLETHKQTLPEGAEEVYDLRSPDNQEFVLYGGDHHLIVSRIVRIKRDKETNGFTCDFERQTDVPIEKLMLHNRIDLLATLIERGIGNKDEEVYSSPEEQFSVETSQEEPIDLNIDSIISETENEQ